MSEDIRTRKELEDILWEHVPINYDGTTGSYQLEGTIDAVCEYIETHYIRIPKGFTSGGTALFPKRY